MRLSQRSKQEAGPERQHSGTSMAPSRKKVPKLIETELLSLCKRRCCVCFFLENETSAKKGQVAHLDHDRNNNKIDNLAWLCLPHHDEYDSRPSQAKGLTRPEVKRHRKALYEFIRVDEERARQIAEIGDGECDTWGPELRAERLWTNLLELVSHPPLIYVAETEFRTARALWEAVRERTSASVRGPLLLSERRIVTFQNLRELPWSELCDLGTCEEFDTEEWSQSEDEQRSRHFVQLLNLCIKEMLWPDVVFDKGRGYYYFRATEDMGPRDISYRSRMQNTTATVFRPYKKKTKRGIAFYRHSAADMIFRRLGELWFLVIGPTFHFTLDGVQEDRYAAEHLRGKKKLEYNSSVSGQTVMWAEFVKSRFSPLVPRPFDLQFSDLVLLKTEVGIDERKWRAPVADCTADGEDLWDL